ncbi:MAG: hypothetical protein KAH14_09790 [Clostridiales bacterium]|nr:hypothetical protein [Clostridiales bacterium]
MKKILILAVALIMVLAVSVTAFAATGETEKKVVSESKRDSLALENQEGRGERLRALFTEYFEEGLDELIEVQEAHISFHENVKVYREEVKNAIAADFEAIKAAVESEDLTRREGRVELIELRMSIRNMRNEIDEVLLQKIEAQAPVHDRMVEVKDEVKTLLEADPVDADAVKFLLEETLSLLSLHLGNDELYHGLFVDIAIGYGY